SNSHGAYKFKGEQHLDLERLKAIKKALMEAGLGDYPLVLYGASSVPKDIVQEVNKYGGRMGEETAGVPEADIEVARRVGCTKVNIDTDLRLAMTAAIRKVFADNPKEFDPRKYLGPAASVPARIGKNVRKTTPARMPALPGFGVVGQAVHGRARCLAQPLIWGPFPGAQPSARGGGIFPNCPVA